MRFFLRFVQGASFNLNIRNLMHLSVFNIFGTLCVCALCFFMYMISSIFFVENWVKIERCAI